MRVGWVLLVWYFFKRLHEEKKKSRFLSSVAPLFLNNKQSIVLFWCCLSGLNTCYFLPLLSPSLSPSTSNSQSAVCALACVITTLPHWGLPLLHVSVCAHEGARVWWCVCILRFCWGLWGGLAAHWVSMGAHTTALPVLISSHAGEQWHQAGGLLERQGTYPKYPTTPAHTHTDTQRCVDLCFYLGLWQQGP